MLFAGPADLVESKILQHDENIRTLYRLVFQQFLGQM
jgi:hypothetical protein